MEPEMKFKSTLLFPLIITMLSASAGPLLNSQSLLTSECEASESVDAVRGKPLIYGEEYKIPALHFNFVEKGSDHKVIPQAIHVHYYWQWIQYPYPEHEWGAWVDAEELVSCSIDQTGRLTVPEIIVRPRGWYDGKYVHFPWSKKPRFDRVEIVIERGSDFPRIVIKKTELSKYLDAVATVPLSSGPPVVTFTKLTLP